MRGWIDEPTAYVMDRVGGQEHFGDTGDEDRAAAELRTLFRLARHLQRRDEIGDAVEQADLDDLELLLGARPHDWRDGEAKLEACVLADTGGKHDTELVRLFHKRNLRAQMLLGPANSSHDPPSHDPRVLTSSGPISGQRPSAASTCMHAAIAPVSAVGHGGESGANLGAAVRDGAETLGV